MWQDVKSWFVRWTRSWIWVWWVVCAWLLWEVSQFLWSRRYVAWGMWMGGRSCCHTGWFASPVRVEGFRGHGGGDDDTSKTQDTAGTTGTTGTTAATTDATAAADDDDGDGDWTALEDAKAQNSRYMLKTSMLSPVCPVGSCSGSGECGGGKKDASPTPSKPSVSWGSSSTCGAADGNTSCASGVSAGYGSLPTGCLTLSGSTTDASTTAAASGASAATLEVSTYFADHGGASIYDALPTSSLPPVFLAM